MNRARLCFSAFDTLFFREARPMEAIGAVPLQGRFPPSARTVAGVARSLAGEALQVDWAAYREGDPSQKAVEDVIGKAKIDTLGCLKLTGPYPLHQGKRLYPAPLHVLKSKQDETVFLSPGPAMDCDIGRARLPKLPASAPKGAKPLENCWLDACDLERVLAGNAPRSPFKNSELFTSELRLGIGMDQARRSVEEGLLYQTIHARLHEAPGIGVEVEGLPAQCQADVTRLGGEGRFAHVSVECCDSARLSPCKPKGWNGVLLTLLTPARFAEGCWYPPDFSQETDEQGALIWTGAINAVKLKIIAAAIGKPMREGGWDLANHRSRPAAALLPAGSVFFCLAEGDPETAAQALQGQKIGHETAWGRGELAAGYWTGEIE
jgi:CRISPR-associated protein Cmr3